MDTTFPNLPFSPSRTFHTPEAAGISTTGDGSSATAKKAPAKKCSSFPTFFNSNKQKASHLYWYLIEEKVIKNCDDKAESLFVKQAKEREDDFQSQLEAAVAEGIAK